MAQSVPTDVLHNVLDCNQQLMFMSHSAFTDNVEREFEIYKTDIEAPGFREFHDRLQTFILFFIDAASYIDVDDDRWTYYLL